MFTSNTKRDKIISGLSVFENYPESHKGVNSFRSEKLNFLSYLLGICITKYQVELTLAVFEYKQKNLQSLFYQEYFEIMTYNSIKIFTAISLEFDLPTSTAKLVSTLLMLTLKSANKQK